MCIIRGIIDRLPGQRICHVQGISCQCHTVYCMGHIQVANSRKYQYEALIRAIHLYSPKLQVLASLLSPLNCMELCHSATS
jgi:hypothetical protein